MFSGISVLQKIAILTFFKLPSVETTSNNCVSRTRQRKKKLPQCSDFHSRILFSASDVINDDFRMTFPSTFCYILDYGCFVFTLVFSAYIF